MLVRVFVFFFLMFSHITSRTQSVHATFERAVTQHNTLRDDAFEWLNDGLNADELSMIRLRAEQALSTIDSVLLSPSSADYPSAPYFRMLIEYRRGHAFGAAGRMEDCYTSLLSLEEGFQRYSPSLFPISYPFKGTNYVIQYSDFANTRWEYFVYMAELTRKRKEYLRSFNYAVMAKDQQDAMLLTRFLASFYYLSAKNDLRLISPEDAATCATHLDLYAQLIKSEQKALYDLESKVYAISPQSFEAILKKAPNFEGKATAELHMARSLKPFANGAVEIHILDRKLYVIAVSDYFEGAIAGGEDALDVLREAYDFEQENFGRESKSAVNYLDQMFAKVLSCADLQWLSGQYAAYGVQEKSQMAAQKAATCKADQAQKDEAALVQLRKDQERLRKEAEHSAKANARAERGWFWYAGWNVLPYLSKPRDVGFVFNVGGKRSAIEVSYLNVREKKENYFDLDLRDINDVPEHKWNGFFAHTQVKLFDKQSSKVHGGNYIGILLGYNERTFLPFQANVLRSSDQTFVESAAFNPSSKQYLFMINYGLQLVKVVGMDVFMGIGAAYNDFNGGNATYWRNPDFAVQDEFIAHRVKNYWSYTMRLGLTVGIGSLKR